MTLDSAASGARDKEASRWHGRHLQHDGRWLSMWCGVRLRWIAFGPVIHKEDDCSAWSFGFCLGPLYAGFGGYDRG